MSKPIHYSKPQIFEFIDTPEAKEVVDVIKSNVEMLKPHYPLPIEMQTFIKAVNDSELESAAKDYLTQAANCAYNLMLKMFYSCHKWTKTPEEERDAVIHSRVRPFNKVYTYVWEHMKHTTREYALDCMIHPNKHPELANYLMVTFEDNGPLYETFALTIKKHLKKWIETMHYKPNLTFTFNTYTPKDGSCPPFAP